MSDTFANLEELKAKAFADSDARKRLTYLFDEGSFTELDAYASVGGELTGVITAFGYVDGNPVYAFSQDISVKNGAMTEAQSRKISKVYDLAAKTGVPVVAVYDSFGADVSDGSKALSAYGKLLAQASNLSGVVLQIAVVAGTCAGCAAMLAQTADITIMAEGASMFVAVNSDDESSAKKAAANGTAAVICADDKSAMETAAKLLSKLPQNNLSPAPMYEFAEPETAYAEDAESAAKAIADADSVIELFAEFGKASYTAFASVNGAAVGIAATNKTKDKLTADDCTKIAKFVRLCDSFSVPVITLVDTEGFESDEKTEAQGAVRAMSKLCHAYAEATTVKISVVTGKAYGPAFIALAGKGANADLSYALSSAIISALAPVTAVEFMEHDELKGAEDLSVKRAELAIRFEKTEASAANAAANGIIDGIAESSQLRKLIIDSLDILAGKRVSRLPKKHSNIQL